MKKTVIMIPGTAAASSKFVAPADPSILVGAKVVPTAAQVGAATVTFGLDGATNVLFTATLTDKAAGAKVVAAANALATAVEKKQVFSVDAPLEITTDLAADSEQCVILEFDEFNISVYEG